MVAQTLYWRSEAQTPHWISIAADAEAHVPPRRSRRWGPQAALGDPLSAYYDTNGQDQAYRGPPKAVEGVRHSRACR